jgi:hypothetical protein
LKAAMAVEVLINCCLLIVVFMAGPLFNNSTEDRKARKDSQQRGLVCFAKIGHCPFPIICK